LKNDFYNKNNKNVKGKGATSSYTKIGIKSNNIKPNTSINYSNKPKDTDKKKT